MLVTLFKKRLRAGQWWSMPSVQHSADTRESELEVSLTYGQVPGQLGLHRKTPS